MRLRATFFALLACLAGMAVAQEMGPPAEMKAWEWTIGEWAGTMKWTMPGMEGDASMSWKNEWDGQFLKSTSSTEMQGMKMTETTFMGWNAKTKKYDQWTFTNFAPTPRIEHGTIDGDKSVWLSEPWEVMGQMMESRATMVKKSNDEVSFLLEFKTGDAWTKAGEGTFKRKRPSVAK